MGILEPEVDNKQNIKESVDPSIRDKLWMIRPCKWYDEEYSDCTRMRSRLHQYFIYGETLDCSQWTRDSANCYRWENNKDDESAKELIDSEIKRREERLAPFYNNDVWEDREGTPENWNRPLPEWMVEEHKTSFLAMKAEEEKNMTSDLLSNRQSLCTIM